MEYPVGRYGPGIAIGSWGPVAWGFLHRVASTYRGAGNKVQKDAMKTVLENLAPLLPCPVCGHHWKKQLEASPLTDDVLATRESLFAWLVDRHNEVNEMSKKPVLTVDEAWNAVMQGKVECACAGGQAERSCPSRTGDIVWTIVITILAVVLVHSVFFNKQ